MMNFEDTKTHIENNYKVIDFDDGHYKTIGAHAYSYKNPFWKVLDVNNKEIILMYCEKNTICKLCTMSYQKILDYEDDHNIKITWFISVNGYVTGNNKLSMHQVIMNCYGNGQGTKNVSVDHIDRNKLNNCYENLRIATFEEQHSNCKGIIPGTKRERKINAKPLPSGITQNMMKKYVVYYHEWLNKECTRQREFFKIEKHPKLNKIWIGTKSNKVSIEEKLIQANKVVDDLEKDIYPVKDDLIVPKYVSIIMVREKPHLVFDKKVDGKRLNIRMVLPENYDLEDSLCILNEKIKEKYEGESVL